MLEKEALNICLRFWRNSTTEGLHLSNLVEFLDSSDRFLQYFATIGIRKLYAIVNAPIAVLIKSGVIPRLLSFLERTEEPDLQVRKSRKMFEKISFSWKRHGFWQMSHLEQLRKQE